MLINSSRFSYNQTGAIHLLVIGLLILGILVGSYLTLNRTSLKSRANEGRAAFGTVALGQTFEPRPGNSCQLLPEQIGCMEFLASGYPCQKLCCGEVSYDKNSGFSCKVPAGYSPGKGLLGAGMSMLKIGDQPTKAAEYRGIPENSLSKKLIVPTFYINFSAFGYNSVAQVSNVDDVDTTLNISFYVTDNFNDIPSQKYSTQVVLKAHQSLELSLGSDNPFIREMVGQALANGRDFMRSMGIIESTNARIVGSVLSFSHIKKPIPEDSSNKTGDANSLINQKLLFENKVNDRNVMSQALISDMSKPQDYFVDTMRPFELGDDNLIIHQLISKFESQKAIYDGGFIIANPTGNTVNFKLNLISRDFDEVVYSISNPLVQRGVLSQVPLKPFETRSYYVPDLQKSVPESPDFPVNYNAGAEIVADAGSKLFSFYYYTRQNDQFGRGTAAFWADSKKQLDQCSTTFPLFNNVSYEGINNMVSGLTVRNFLGSGNLNGELTKKDNSSAVTRFDFPNSDWRAVLLFLPGDRTEIKYPNSIFSAKVCKNNGAVGTSSNSFRNNNNVDFINFGLTGFPDSWQDSTYYVPYFMYNYGSTKAESWVIPYNPNADSLKYNIRFYLPNGSFQDFNPGNLNSRSFENRVFGPTQPLQGGYIKVIAN